MAGRAQEELARGICQAAEELGLKEWANRMSGPSRARLLLKQAGINSLDGLAKLNGDGGVKFPYMRLPT